MIDTQQLVQYAQHPELALQNLAELLSLMGSEDETIQNFANEALENCGSPARSDLPLLVEQVEGSEEGSAYWACTLLGRFEPANEQERFQLQAVLCKAVCNHAVPLAVRERAVWAIGELGAVDSTSQRILNEQRNNASPRLLRLLDTALGVPTAS